MNAVYATALVLGVLGLIVTLVAPASVQAVRGSAWRRAVVALTALGLGGLSASFAGLPAAVVVLLAVAAAAILVRYADRVSA